MRTDSLEASAIAAISSLASVDAVKARDMLDKSGVCLDDFTGHHATIWGAVEAMVRAGGAPDFFAVEAKCRGVPRQALVGALVSGDASNPLERLRAVRDAGCRRRVALALNAVHKLIQDASRPIADAVGEARKALELVNQQEATSRTMVDAVFDFAQVLDDIAQGKKQPVLETGIDALDATIGGLQPTLTVIGALPGVGKSGLLAGIVRNLCRRGVRVGMFSLEDERSWLVKRLASESSGVPLFVLQNKPLNGFQATEVHEALARLHQDMASLVVDDRTALTAADVVSSAREMIVSHGVKALLVDHLGEIRLERSERHDLDIADALQQLRALAKDYGVPVVVACHLKRRDGLGIKDEPKLTDFAFSAGVERMSRVALALSKPEEGKLRVHVLKQTNGIAGVSVDLSFTGPAGVVRNVAAGSIRQNMEGRYADFSNVG